MFIEKSKDFFFISGINHYLNVAVQSDQALYVAAARGKTPFVEGVQLLLTIRTFKR